MNKGGSVLSQNDIVEPYGDADGPLIMVISCSPVYRETFQTYLLDFGYRVAGPFENVDQGHAFLRREFPDLIIFDAMTTQSELITYSNLLKNEASKLPTIVLHNGESFTISHTQIEFLFPPISPNAMEEKIRGLIGGDEDHENPVHQFVKFVNDTLSTLVELAPEFAIVDLKSILNDEINTFAVRNSEITTKSEETLLLQLRNVENINILNLAASFEILLEEVIEKIDKNMEAEWGKSLVEDTLEAVTIKYKNLPDPAIRIIEDMGKGYSKVIKKFKYAVPSLEDIDKNITVAKLLLTDWGPELTLKISSDPSFGDEFNDDIASQLITLVGQGSRYHQGIFGPVPIPKTEDVISIIWSKLIESDIRDERMEGRTLVLVAIAFRQALLNSIPSRENIKKIFEEIEQYEHEEKIDELALQKIAELFNGQLK